MCTPNTQKTHKNAQKGEPRAAAYVRAAYLGKPPSWKSMEDLCQEGNSRRGLGRRVQVQLTNLIQQKNRRNPGNKKTLQKRDDQERL